VTELLDMAGAVLDGPDPMAVFALEAILSLDPEQREASGLLAECRAKLCGTQPAQPMDSLELTRSTMQTSGPIDW
jgi:hypothetical protein